MNSTRERRIGDLDVLEIPGDLSQGCIVLLHGFGADAYDLLSLSNVYSGPSWIFPQGPHLITLGPGHRGRAWFPVDIMRLTTAIQERKFDEVSKAFPQEIHEAQLSIEKMVQELGVARHKVILGGFSQGAVLATETLLKSPAKSGALLIFSGTLINEANWKELAPLHASTPFFQSHGAYDSLLPLQKAEELERLLLDAGLHGKLHSFQGGHEIPHSTIRAFTSFLKTIFETV